MRLGQVLGDSFSCDWSCSYYCGKRIWLSIAAQWIKLSVRRFVRYIILLGNTITTALYIFLQKKFIFDKEDSYWKTKPVAVTAWSYMFGAMFFALASLCSIKKPEKFTHFPIEEVYPTTYAIFNTSGLCYIFISWCNLQISASLVTATWPLQIFFLFHFFLLDVRWGAESS